LERGNAAGQAYLEIFKNLADSLKRIGPLHQVVKPEILNSYVFNKIEVNGNVVVNDAFIIGKMKFEAGKELSIDEIEKRIEFIYGTQYFEKVQYQIHGEKNNRTLKIIVVERPEAHFRFSYHYDSENNGGIIGNVTLRNLLLNSSRLIFEADMSGQPAVFLEYFKYMGKKQNFAIAARGIYSNKDFPLYNMDGDVNNIYSSNYYKGGFKIQSTSVQSSTFGFGINWSDMTLNQTLTSDDELNLNKVKYNNTRFSAFYKFNNLNDWYFPTKGVRSNMELSLTSKTSGKLYINDEIIDAGTDDNLLQTSGIMALKIDVLPLIPIDKKLTIIPKARLNLSSMRANTLNVTEYDFVGGFVPGLINSTEYYGGGPKEFVLANYFYGRLGAQYEIVRNLFLQAHVNFLTVDFPLTFFYPNADTGSLGNRNSRFGYGGNIGFKSPVGPIAFAFAKDHFRPGWKTSLIIGFYY